jgi:hypothetical protein
MAGKEFIYPPPSDGKPFRLMMGLRTCLPENWLEISEDLIDQLPERQNLIKNKRDVVFAQLPGYEMPADEFARQIVSNLTSYHSDTYQIHQESLVTHKPSGYQVDIIADHPFIQLAQVIGEDLCLISKIHGEWLLTAAVVVYPSRWNLSEKIGKSLDAIHQPVPGYQTTLQPAMSITFDKLTADRQVWRLNWALHADNNLHQPTATRHSNAPEDYWWRTERQTLSKLAVSNHVLFTIRNRVERLDQIWSNPSHAEAFAQTLSSMSADTIEYKGLTQDHKSIVDYLLQRNIFN